MFQSRKTQDTIFLNSHVQSRFAQLSAIFCTLKSKMSRKCSTRTTLKALATHAQCAGAYACECVCALWERKRERETWGQWPTLGRVTKSSTESKFIKPLPSSMGSHGSLSPHTIKTGHCKKKHEAQFDITVCFH